MRTDSSIIVLDLDGTLTQDTEAGYPDKPVRDEIRRAAWAAASKGFGLTVATARGMRSRGNDVDRITRELLPEIHAWLAKHGIIPDRVIVGKVWAGPRGFYVDDRALHPEEFAFRFLGPFQDTNVVLDSQDAAARDQAERLFSLVSEPGPGTWSLWIDPQAPTGALRRTLAALIDDLEAARTPVVGKLGNKPVVALGPMPMIQQVKDTYMCPAGDVRHVQLMDI